MVQPIETNTTTDATSGFVDAIRSSNFLSERQLEKLDASMAKAETPTEPAELAARLVKDGVLTEYQAKQVLKGKAQGLTFGSYVILEFLGKGTMGKVYKASHRMMGRVVALKILEPRSITSTRSLARFQREMQLVGRLDHPNVVRAFDADRVGDCHFIAMEYVDGFTLEDLLKARGALPPADVVYYGSQVADGLAHAHAQGVLHRDIKPSNLLLTKTKKLKVLDFGLGTLLEKDELDTALTSAGLAVGTPDYISPEQARTVKIDRRSDLYSLGCTMYHLLSGQLPFKGESSMDCLVGRITGKPVPIGEVMPGLPARLVQTIEKLMASNPDDRYQTADEAATALRTLLRPKNAPTSSSSAATVAATPPAVPEPVAKEVTPIEAPAPPVLARVRSSEPKAGSLGSRWAGRVPKANLGLAAGAVAVAAALLIGATFVFFKSSSDENPAFPQGTLGASNGPSLPAASPNVRPTSLVVEHPKQAEAATVSMKKDLASPALPAVASNARQASLVIEIPKQGATVSMREELTGLVESDGWPVIFVQADIPGQLWWCQAPVENVEGGKFSTNVVFGDGVTPRGTKFRIAGIVTRTRDEARKFAMGSNHPALPEGFPKSVEVTVTRQ
jgi:eukaryotic-like serine/threonine-protein kinase